MAAAAVDLMVSPPIELASLLDRCQGMAPLVEKLLNSFQGKLQQQLSEMTDSVAKADGVALSRVAHSLKGAAANLSAEPICQRARQLEMLGLHGDITDAAVELEHLQAEVESCIAFIPVAIRQSKTAITPQLPSASLKAASGNYQPLSQYPQNGR